MNSEFIFRTYKIDRLSLKVQPSVEMLETKIFDQERWQFRFRIRNPLHYKSREEFLVGMDCQIRYIDPSDVKDTANTSEQSSVLVLEIGIAGLFSFTENSFEPDLVDKLVKIQGPALLASYVRSAATTILASSGFGTLIFPLVNFYKIAEKSDVQIEIVE